MISKKINVILSDEAEAFVSNLPDNVQKKIAYNILRIESGIKDSTLFKKLSPYDIWELRTLADGICYRLLAFWDTDFGSFVIATHGIVKKTQKVPQKEILKAQNIRTIYYNSKKK